MRFQRSLLLQGSVAVVLAASAPAQPVTPASHGTRYTRVVYDDFTTYANTTAFLANVGTALGGTGGAGALYNDGGNAMLASIDTTVRYDGHQTLKYTQPGGVGRTPELWVGLPGGLSVMWLRVKIRFSPGWTTTGTLTNCANAYKLLGWGWTTYDGSGRVEITNTTEYELYWGVQATHGGPALSDVQFGHGGSVRREWSDGRWYDYIVQVDFSKPVGIARLWIAPDGERPMLRALSMSEMRNGVALPALKRIMLGLNFNQMRTPAQNQALWYGAWEVVDGVKYPNPYGL